MEQLPLFSNPTPIIKPEPTPELKAATLTSISVVAKTLGIGTNRFFAKLRADHILGRDNLPTQKCLDAGHFKVVKHEHHWPGSSQVSYDFVTKVTDKGLDWLTVQYKGRL